MPVGTIQSLAGAKDNKDKQRKGKLVLFRSWDVFFLFCPWALERTASFPAFRFYDLDQWFPMFSCLSLRRPVVGLLSLHYPASQFTKHIPFICLSMLTDSVSLGNWWIQRPKWWKQWFRYLYISVHSSINHNRYNFPLGNEWLKKC